MHKVKNKLKFLLVREFDVPMEPVKLKRFYEYLNVKNSFWQKKNEEYKLEEKIWGDGTGPAISLIEMDADTYVKYMSDAEIWEEWHRFCRVADNARIRTLVPGMNVPPE
jgi:hypothetical protein